MAATDTASIPDGIRITRMRVENFRSLRDAYLPLGDMTVLVGENNAGKTSVLEALAVALGGRARFTDLTLDEAGNRAQSFRIDLRIEPASGDIFSADYAGIFGEGVQGHTSGGADYVNLRTTGTWNAAEDRIDTLRQYVKGWEDGAAAAAKLGVGDRVKTGEVFDVLVFQLLGAQRDLVDQLRTRSSPWGRLMGNLKLAEAVRKEIESALGVLGGRIVSESSVLARVRTELGQLARAIRPGVGGAEIQALPTRVEELVRAMEVLVSATHGPALPIAQHGMGTRSLAALIVFRAFVSVGLLSAKRTFHPVSAFEEPEAHLHPQAQRAVFPQIAEIPGQRIVSTHSPFVAGVANVFDYRVFRRCSRGIEISWIPARRAGKPTFGPDERDQVRRFFQRRHGEALFARAVVLFEGDEEAGALGVFAWARFEQSPDALGLSLVGVDGAGKERLLARALLPLRIPTAALLDGDKAGTEAARGLAAEIASSPADAPSHVVVIPGGASFARHLVDAGFGASAERGIGKEFGPSALTDFKARQNHQRKGKTEVRDYDSPGWEGRLVVDFLSENKGRYGRAVAEAIVADAPEPASWPVAVRELLDWIGPRLGL